jgi:formamidopyrimidine-DNA glycosylase
MFPQAEVCDLLEGVGTLWADEALFIAGRQVSKAVCMVRAFALVADDQRAAPRSLVAHFTVVTAAASSEPEDGYHRLVACVYQRKHVASYQRVDIPVELVIH